MNVPSRRTPFPGIWLVRGQACARYAQNKTFETILERHYGAPLKPYCKVGVKDWLLAYGVSNRPSANNYYSDGDSIAVIFDGYLSDYVGLNTSAASNTPYAESIGTLYRSSELSFLGGLRGSYICLVVDSAREKAFLFSDRQGSRPMFLRELADGSTFYAPQVKFLSGIEPRQDRLNTSAAGQFLIRGCFYGSNTLFESIHKFPQGNVVEFSNRQQYSRQYWSFNFKEAHIQTTGGGFIDEFDKLISKATRRLLNVVDSPLLLLSGGLDSRLMLAYLMKESEKKIPSLSYMVHGTDGDDHVIAKRLSEHCGLEHETYEIHENDYSSIACKEVLAVDGRVQVLDSPSNRWEHIGEKYDSIFVGDECFGWGRTAHSVPEALDIAGWFNLDKARRISDWLKPAVRRSIHEQIKGIQRRLVANTAETIPSNIKDKLYYTERMGNMLNGYGARRLWLMEQARPFLDEDVIEFISALAIEDRQDKSLARRLMEANFPELHAIPYSKRDSVPWRPPQFIRLTAENDELRKFIVYELTDGLNPRLAEMFDQDRLAETIPVLFLNGKIPPLRGDWWVRLPGLWRYSRDRYDKVGALRGALRLLGLSLYLND